MALPVNKGQKVAQYEDILADMIVTTSTDAGCTAGEVYTTAPFVFIVPVTTTKDGSDEQIVPGWTEGHFVVRKKAGGGLTWAKGDALTFSAVGGVDYLEARKAVADENIHAYAFKAALATDTEGQIIGPFLPPFAVYGTMADVLAAILTADEGQVLVADGAGGVSVTSYVIPLTDGAANQVFETDGAEALTWQAQEDTALKTLVTGKADGQIVIADGANGYDVTLWNLPGNAVGGENQILKAPADPFLAVTWAADATE